MSRNSNLLTSSLMVLYNLLKPFKYTYPMIFSLPEVLLPLCDDFLNFMKTAVFAVFEEFKTIIFADASFGLSVVEPHLGGVKVEVAALYEKFNNEHGRTMEYGTFKSETKIATSMPAKSLEGNRADHQAHRRRSKLSKSMMYHATEADINHCEKILSLFHDSFIKNIINHIPNEPIYTPFSKDKDLDYTAIAKLIIEKNPKDKAFLESFLLSQAFCYYLEVHYSKKAQSLF
eukprot:CAMPEP_0176408552 /NCGR_PEP_ID=MMETSP0127-20121128/2015_1 /TAXON_ID=938130 /ORGANISM="Platyophrya macrostoma, Strain WH" /LENGTH=230 /DNA_ID=CAMNT_0017787851 /DNA_START=1 /DNA_END=692 /DNA_ORIENTATION=-